MVHLEKSSPSLNSTPAYLIESVPYSILASLLFAGCTTYETPAEIEKRAAAQAEYKVAIAGCNSQIWTKNNAIPKLECIRDAEIKNPSAKLSDELVLKLFLANKGAALDYKENKISKDVFLYRLEENESRFQSEQSQMNAEYTRKLQEMEDSAKRGLMDSMDSLAKSYTPPSTPMPAMTMPMTTHCSTYSNTIDCTTY